VVYIGSEDGRLFAVDAANGSERWRFEDGDPSERTTTPTVGGDTVYFAQAGVLYARDAATGGERWRNDLGDGARAPAYSAGVVYTGGTDGLVYAIDAASGDVRWTFATGDQILATPIVADGVVYAASFDHILYALDAASGDELWRFAIEGDVDNGPSLADGVLYVSTSFGILSAIGGSDAAAGATPGAGPTTIAPTPEATPVAASEAMPVAFLWQSSGGPDSLVLPPDLAIHPDGTVWVLDAGSNRIQILSPDGEHLETWGEAGTGEGQFDFARNGPAGALAFDSEGNLYVADAYNARIQKFDANRQFVAAWGSFGSGDGQFLLPSGLAIDGDGNVYVSDFEADDIQKFDADGNFLVRIGGSGSEPGQLDGPSYPAVDAAGNLYVPEVRNGRVSTFAPDGAYLTSWGSEGSGEGQFRDPNGTAVDASGAVYVADDANHRVQVFDAQGGFLTAWGDEGSGDGQFEHAASVEVDGDGNVYVADIGNGRIQKFRPLPPLAPAPAAAATSTNDAAVAAPAEVVWRTTGGPEPLTFTSALAFDPEGNLWVSDGGRNRFQIFAADGTFLETWGEGGSGDGQFNFRRSADDSIAGLAFAADGGFYVADAHNFRVQQFDAERNFVRAWGSFGTGDGQFVEPIGVNIDAAGNVYVIDDRRDVVQKFDGEGHFLLAFGGHGTEEGQINAAGWGAIDAQGNLWVADSGNRLQQFAPDGTFRQSIGSSGAGDGQLHEPQAVAIDEDGRLYVTDGGNARVQIFAADGQFIAAWRGDDAGGTRFENTVGIALDGAGHLYVHDYSDDYEAVQKFRLLPPLAEKAVASNEEAVDWTTFRGNAARDGQAGVGPVGEPVLLWRFQADGLVDPPPAVAADVVYAASGDGFLYALDAATGAERWRFEADGGIGGSPTVAGETVYVADDAGTLYAVETATGAERWRLGTPIASASAPAVVADLLYIGTEDGALLAIDTATAEERWRFAVAEQGAVNTPAVAAGVVYVGSEAGGFVAVDALTGEELWRGDTGDDALGTAVAADGIAYIGGSGDGGGHLYAFDAANGELLWRLDEALYTPAVLDGVAYSASFAGTFAALDPATGEERWRIELGGPLRPPAVANGIVYVPSDGDRAVYALDAATGEQLWRFDVDGAIDGPIAVADGVAYVGTALGGVYAIGGSEAVGTPVAASPVVAAPDGATPEAQARAPETEFLWETSGGAAAFDVPYGMTIDPEGNLWVADAHDQFQIFAPDGTYLETWGAPGSDAGQLDLTLPDGNVYGSVMFAPDGSLYIDDTGNGRVQKFDRNRSFVAAWSGDGTGDDQAIVPVSIAIDAGGQLYVLDSGNDTVRILDGDLTPIQAFRVHEALGVSPELARNQSNFVTLDDDGNVYVSSALRGAVLKFDPDGTLLAEIGGPGAGDGQFTQPVDIAFDAAGNLLVPDLDSGVVEVFAPDGSHLATLGAFGAGPGQFAGPAGILISGQDIYVSEIDNNRVQKFRLLPPLAPA
jgi:outer membrane protein assembly factor BamB